MLRFRVMVNQSKTIDAEQLFRAFADKTRLRLINLIGDDEVCVCYLTEILRAPQPTISRHLSYLRRSGIVAARREGKWMHYRLVMPQDPNVAMILEDVKHWLANDKMMQADRKRLVKFCCATDLPVHLKDAPKPVATRSELNLSVINR